MIKVIFYNKNAFDCNLLMFFCWIEYKINIFAVKSVIDTVLSELGRF